MKTRYHLLAAALCAAGLSPLAGAQSESTHTRFGVEKPFQQYDRIQVKNFQDESLGRIKDLGIDLINGRIVEVLVVADDSLGIGDRIVAVPPRAFYPDLLNEVYRINVRPDVFKRAAAIDLSNWVDAGRSDRVAAAYRHFGQEPYFLEEGGVASPDERRPKVALGYVERASKILDLPVGNFQNEKFGKVWGMSFNIPQGQIQNVIVLAPGNFKTKSIIPATALSFNSTRDGLLLDDTKLEYADEPRYVFTEEAYGQEAYSKEESYQGPRTAGALEQGTSYRDVDTTVRINREIRAAKIDDRNVQVGTINGRVTLRGWAGTDADRRRIGEIAIAAARQELVDNQIQVGRPPSGI